MAASSRPWWAWGCHDQMTERDRRNMWRLNLWLAAWMSIFVAATWLVRRGGVDTGPWNLLVAIVPNLPAVVVVIMYLRFLREADELMRKIHLEAMALAFGLGVVFMVAYGLFESVGAPSLGVSDPIIPMVAIYAVTQSIAVRRYR